MAKLKCPACKSLFPNFIYRPGDSVRCPKCGKQLKLPNQPNQDAEPTHCEDRLWEVGSTINDEIYGPYLFEELVTYVSTGRILRETPVRHPVHTLGAWIPAIEIPELTSSFPADIEENQSEGIAIDRPDQVRDRVPTLQRRTSRTSSSFLMDFLDPTFKYYVTPTIIAITWVICLVLGFIGFSLFAFVVVGSNIEWPTLTNNKEIRNDAERAEQMVQEANIRRANARQPEVRQPVQPVQPVQLIPETISRVSRKAIISALVTISQLVLTFLSILWIRVVLECIIVLFHISTAVKGIHEIEFKRFQQPRP